MLKVEVVASQVKGVVVNVLMTEAEVLRKRAVLVKCVGSLGVRRQCSRQEVWS